MLSLSSSWDIKVDGCNYNNIKIELQGFIFLFFSLLFFLCLLLFLNTMGKKKKIQFLLGRIFYTFPETKSNTQTPPLLSATNARGQLRAQDTELTNPFFPAIAGALTSPLTYFVMGKFKVL